jgi:hypothetical protein
MFQWEGRGLVVVVVVVAAAAAAAVVYLHSLNTPSWCGA